MTIQANVQLTRVDRRRSFPCQICTILPSGAKAQGKTVSDDIMTVREVAAYLKVNERTIYRLVTDQKIPSFKVGGSWRFKKGAIDQWVQQNTILRH